jgi:conjugative relaxase-like TrwC/TraI family protein
VTARVTPLKGADAGAYYVEQVGDYYLDPTEPAGVWLGRGARELSLTGRVDGDVFLRVMRGDTPYGQAIPLGRLYGERSVRGFDVTASAPKSVSVLFGIGDENTRRQVVEAHDAAVAAMAGWIERHAHTRRRVAGEVVTIDSDGLVMAAFRQHTSRALDPQLHTHLIVANRVMSPDGRWLALDARTLLRDQRTLSAIYHAGLRAELTHRLGVRWREPVNGIAEIADMHDHVLTAFSARTDRVDRRLDVKLERFLDTFDRDPTPRERWKLEREAVLDSRPAKRHTSDALDHHAHWTDQLADLGLTPTDVARVAIGYPPPSAAHSASAIVEHALATIAEQQSTWRPAELTRELAAATSTSIATTADALTRWLDDLTDHTVAAYCVDLSPPASDTDPLRRDGRPFSEPATARRLTTPGIVAEEQQIIDWADRRLARTAGLDSIIVGYTSNRLTAAQRQVAEAVAGSNELVFVVGPAGTGKTTALKPAVEQLHHDHRPVFGLALSASAAEVLAAETGVAADTLDKLLTEYRNGRPSTAYRLPVGTTVIVDEASMVPTAKLAALTDLADVNRWRIALVGDPLQFSAIGRGGMFAHLIDTFGSIDLDQVHRFRNAWERDASLELRRGNADVIDLYEDHGRIHGGGAVRMERDIIDRWWNARHEGRTALVMAPSNVVVERLNEKMQRRRLSAGELWPEGPTVGAGRYTLYVGDEIVTRRNDRSLRTDQGEMVKNRAAWTITSIEWSGAVRAEGANGKVRLPAEYVAEHVELGYACNEMVAQGRTVDEAFLYLDRPTTARGLYVGMTRGAQTNEVYVATIGDELARDVVEESMHRDWVDEPALAHAEVDVSVEYRWLDEQYPEPADHRRRSDYELDLGIGP